MVLFHMSICALGAVLPHAAHTICDMDAALSAPSQLVDEPRVNGAKAGHVLIHCVPYCLNVLVQPRKLEAREVGGDGQAGDRPEVILWAGFAASQPFAWAASAASLQITQDDSKQGHSQVIVQISTQTVVDYGRPDRSESHPSEQAI